MLPEMDPKSKVLYEVIKRMIELDPELETALYRLLTLRSFAKANVQVSGASVSGPTSFDNKMIEAMRKFFK